MQTKSKGLDFAGKRIYIGLDVHQKTWTACIFSEQLEFKKVSLPASAAALKGYLEQTFPGASYYSCYEAGFCGFHVHRELEAAGIRNIVVNAADVPATHKEYVQKDDRRDSRKLGRSLRSAGLTGIHIPTRKTQEDRSLVRLRYTVRKDLTRTKLRIKSFLSFYGIAHPAEYSSPSQHWSSRYMEWLRTIPMETAGGRTALQTLVLEAERMRQTLLDVTRAIRTLSKTAAYEKDYRLLSGITGMGLITGMSFLSEIEDINRFSSADRIASYVGLIPSSRSSGEKENNGAITRRAHFLLRDMIVESAWIAARHDPALHLAYCDLSKRMKPNKAIIRIARKLLNRIYFVLKNKKEYVSGTVK